MAFGTALAIGGLATNLLAGLFGKKSANKAADIQAQAAAAAGKKVEDTVASTNPAVLEAAKVAGDSAKATAATGSSDVKTTATNANNLLNPYATAGATASDVLNKGIADGGDFNRKTTAADIQIDPGFDFRYGQAQKDFESYAGAHGGVDNGGALRDFEKLRQGLRSQEYQAAFDRFQKSTQQRYANVFGVAQQGQQAATTQGNNLTDASRFGASLLQRGEEYAGDKNVNATDLTTGRTIQGATTAADYATQGANAKAAGEVAGTNALWNGVTGGMNSVQNGLLLNKYGLPQTAHSTVPSTSPGRWTRPNIFNQIPGPTAAQQQGVS